MSPCKVLWFTGLSGAGKTTIALRAAQRLSEDGKAVKVLDGDEIRAKLHKHLGFSAEDIKENNRLVANLCMQYMEEFDVLLVPIISPFRESRKNARKVIGENFVEVYVKASLEKVMQRDSKGLYKKALEGQIPNFIGIDKNVPYEEPLKPDIIIDTDQEEIEASVRKLLSSIII